VQNGIIALTLAARKTVTVVNLIAEQGPLLPKGEPPGQINGGRQGTLRPHFMTVRNYVLLDAVPADPFISVVTKGLITEAEAKDLFRMYVPSYLLHFPARPTS
jgi:hypothetical protein